MRAVKARLAVVVGLLLSLVACGGGASAVSEARAACKSYLPAVAGPTAVSHEEVQTALAQSRAALAQAAKAARKDARWNSLDDAYSAMVDTWVYDASVIEPAGLNSAGVPNVTSEQLQTYNGLYDSFQAAAKSARAECAKADA